MTWCLDRLGKREQKNLIRIFALLAFIAKFLNEANALLKSIFVALFG